MPEKKPSKKSKKVEENVIRDTSLKIEEAPKQELSEDLQKLIHDWNSWERDRKWQ